MTTTTSKHELPTASGPVTTTEKRKPEGRFLTGFSHVFLAVWGLMVGVPLIWATVQSFRSDDEILHQPLSLPTSWHIGAFGRAWTKGHIGEYFFNTIVVMTFSVTLSMLFGAMVAYVLARYRFPGNRAIYYLFFTGLVMPIFLGLIPLYKTVQNLAAMLGLSSVIGLNTYGGLILVYIAYSLPFTVFFLHSFFRTLSTDVAEAGLIDGASHTTLFFRVMLPMAKPGLVSIGLFNIIGQWNQFILPNLLMKPQSGFEEGKFVLTQGLLNLVNNSKYETDWARLFAGMTLAMLPILVTYLVFNRQIQAGLTGSITK
ncbi:MAG: carbohydrate ABC transporter permease [Hamadaea sp.]|uniref:carbohydrate ABC transporter permease n=1 Tax=Hamadaea sp. TaxID=2024425 RepID=UPI0017944807|nr:carbohydrate ABC transporter permease [Hamadaea sp.]NUR73371.1 carbohydrate ABC transporter permease [Hamadaea sp.]NUT18518.1 carbohydrate ABC transporter permease [Hamadaea sp.]